MHCETEEQAIAICKLMHFVKKETAELFLKNFKEQLETVKKFL